MADRATCIGAELIETEGVESRSGEWVVGIERAVAKVFVDRAMQLVCSRLRNSFNNRPKIAPVICGVGAIDDTELVNPVERRAHALYAREADGVVGAVEPEERAVCFAQACKTKLEHGLLKRRLCRRGCTPSNVDRRSQQRKIDKIPACNREIRNLSGPNHLARFRPSSVNTLYGSSETVKFCFTEARPSSADKAATWPTVSVSERPHVLKPLALTLR